MPEKAMVGAEAPRQSGARGEILEAAIELMRQSGLTGAGINQVIAQSHAPKGSMYHHFPGGKLQLVNEALALYSGRVARAMDAALGSRTKPGEKIQALFRYIADRLERSHFERSCAAGAVALDLNPEFEDIRSVVADAMGSWREVIAGHIPVRSRARRDSLAGLVMSAIEGAYIRGRVERSSAAILEAGDWIARLVEAEVRAESKA